MENNNGVPDADAETACANLDDIDHLMDELKLLTSPQNLKKGLSREKKELVKKMRDVMNSLDETNYEVGDPAKGSRDAPGDVPPEDPNRMEKVEILKPILQSLRSKKFLKEREAIIEKLRYMADFVEASEKNYQQAERRAKGFGIGGGLLTLAGIAAAPLSGGLSLTLTATGLLTGLGAGVTTLGVNIASSTTQRNSLTCLEQDLKKHVTHIEELTHLTGVLLIKPTLMDTIQNLTVERLGRLRQELMVTIPKLIELYDSESYAEIQKICNNHVNPDIQFIIQFIIGILPLRWSPECRQALAAILTRITNDIHDIGKAIFDFIKYLVQSNVSFELGGFAVVSWYARDVSGSWKNLNPCVKWLTSLKTVGSDPALQLLTMVSALGSIIFGAHSIIRKWDATGETPTVRKLREMADALEAEFIGVQEEIAELEMEIAKLEMGIPSVGN